MPRKNEDPRTPGAKDFPPQQQRTPGREAGRAAAPADRGEASHVGHGRLADRVAIVTGGGDPVRSWA